MCDMCMCAYVCVICVCVRMYVCGGRGLVYVMVVQTRRKGVSTPLNQSTRKHNKGKNEELIQTSTTVPQSSSSTSSQHVLSLLSTRFELQRQHFEQDVNFLILNHLKQLPGVKSIVQQLEDELYEQELLPTSVTWQGTTRKKTCQELEQTYPHVTPTYLSKLLERSIEVSSTSLFSSTLSSHNFTRLPLLGSDNFSPLRPPSCPSIRSNRTDTSSIGLDVPKKKSSSSSAPSLSSDSHLTSSSLPFVSPTNGASSTSSTFVASTTTSTTTPSSSSTSAKVTSTNTIPALTALQSIPNGGSVVKLPTTIDTILTQATREVGSSSQEVWSSPFSTNIRSLKRGTVAAHSTVKVQAATLETVTAMQLGLPVKPSFKNLPNLWTNISRVRIIPPSKTPMTHTHTHTHTGTHIDTHIHVHT